jgi:mannose-6-phosphate isomerase-like protein (cupin superfamily)
VIEQIQNIKDIQYILTEAITDYNAYESGDVKFIKDYKDYAVKDAVSYGQWVANYRSFPVIKINGLENLLSIDSETVHLFVNNESNYSFDWHKDDVDVFLYVVKGKKKVHIEQDTVELSEGEGVHIPKGSMHKVYSDADTWALSIQL